MDDIIWATLPFFRKRAMIAPEETPRNEIDGYNRE
jgi:hypothetical protein